MQHAYLLTSLRGLALAGLLAGTTATAHAQALNYFAVNAQTSTNTTSYTDLGTTGTAIATPNTDDANSAAQDIGFTLTFGGASYTQFVLNTNGYLRLGATAPVGAFFSNGALDVSGGPLNSADTNLILPFNTDLEAGSSGTEYRVATTGVAGSRITTIQWKNVSDKARPITPGNATLLAKQYANLSFQVRLYEGSNAIEFAYGPATASANAATGSYVSVGLKGNGLATNQLLTLSKGPNTSWGFAAFRDGNYATGSTGFGVIATVRPDVNRTYHFDAALNNDAATTTLYNIEQLPAGQAFAYRALVTNKGATAQTNLAVTLGLSGANAATSTQTVSLAPGGQAVVTWPSLLLPNAGTTTVAVTLPADDNSTNNTQMAATLTSSTAAVFSYSKTSLPNNSTFGFGPSSAPYTSAACAAYTTTTAFTFTAVRALLGTSSANVGQKVYGILADLNGNILGQSAEYTLQAADQNTLHTFTLTTPVTRPAGTVLAGLAQEVNTVLYFPISLQSEVPGRPGTFYQLNQFSPAAPRAPRDVSSFNNRFLVEATGSATPLATASPVLTRALSVYPNPSASGRFTLEVRGANAPAGLTVAVRNQLGQVVYTGTAPDNATTVLDLSQLSTGLYHLQLRQGDSFTSRQLSIIR